MIARHEVANGGVDRFRPFFAAAALYDGLLGVAFLAFAGPIFAALGSPLDGLEAYVRLLAAFIATQGLGYAIVWRDPTANAGIVTVGAAYKLAYIAVVLGSAALGQLPHAMYALFAAIDVLFLIGFLLYLRAVAEAEHVGPSARSTPTRGG